MGLLSWLFPSPADKIAKAERFMADERFAEARALVADLEEEAAKALVAKAEEGLVRLNLDHALAFCRAGNEAQVEHHLQLAERFHDEGLEDAFEAFKVEAARLRRERAAAVIFDELAAAAKRRAELGPDPGDFSWVAFNGDGSVQLVVDEKSPLGLPRLVVQPDPAFFKPIEPPQEGVALTPEEAAKALKATYPEALRAHFEGHEVPIGEATLAMMDSAPERAVMGLLKQPEDNPVIRLELARAAGALGVHSAADTLLEQVVDLHGAHFEVGATHTAQLHAATAAWLGDHEYAFELLEPLVARAPHLFAAVAITTQRLDEAKKAIVKMHEEDAEDPRLPQLGTAWALEETARQLRSKYPILKGLVPETIEGQAQQMEGIQADFQPLLEEATSKLPSMNIEWRGPGEDEEDEEEA